MQVPEHVVSLYVATCGQNGPGLGSDEKEIILLVYVIMEAATGQIVGTKQLLVRPAVTLVKNRTASTSSETSANSPPSPTLNSSSSSITTTTTTTTVTTAAAAANTINDFNSSNIWTNSNNNSIILNCNNKNIIANEPINNNNIKSNNNNNNDNNSKTSLLLDTSNQHTDLPIAVAQVAGKPLIEAIEEFDEYLRSLSLADVDFKLITDGQLPLRQCLHREACAKDIELPSYYNRFCDLRKEFLQFRAGDLSRALVPVKDIKKILQIPTLPLPQSIAEMMSDLSLTSIEDVDFYVRESRDMVSVIQAMIRGGHKFTANEEVTLVLEPGICSIDDEIDGNCIVRARGLPWQSSDQDIAKFFGGLNVAKGGVALCLSPLGRRNGEALVRFVSQEHRDMALKRHKHHIGNRYIEVYRATGEDFLAIAGGASNEAQAFLSKGAQVIIRMRGLPYDCTAKQVLDFFTTGEKPCDVLDGVEGVLFVKKPDGRATGDAFVLFANEADAPNALSRHRESIGQRYIELFRSTTAEVQQVLNRSMDPKTYEQNHQPPLIAQLPAVLLPQHLITSGTTKNCIRLRGLPYEALVEHILHFLDDFAKHIIYQGVHMVINAQGQPSGEAFIQMDSEESARTCAQRKHNQFMVFGKKYRYIEVFQCSGDDMNMVLNGGLQSPVSAHHVHLPGAAKQPPLLSPGMLAQPPPPTAQALSTHTHAHAHVHAHHPHSHSHPHAAPQHSLHTSNSVAAAVAAAALAQQPHTQLSLVGSPPHVPAVASMAPFLTTAPTGSAHARYSSLAAAAAHTNAAAAAAAVAAAQSAVGLPQPHLQLASPSSATIASPQASSLPLSFNILPHTQQQATSNMLLAQQQAQFIAQHNLLARQQAAAVAAEQQQQQQQLYANLMMQHQAVQAAAAASHGPAAVAMAAPPGVAGQPQFVLMPRPYFQSFPIGYQFASSPQGYQFASSPGAATAATAAGLPTGTSGLHTPALSHSMKRSYDNAFQTQETNAAGAAKRALTRGPSNLYQFYNPGV